MNHLEPNQPDSRGQNGPLNPALDHFKQLANELNHHLITTAMQTNRLVATKEQTAEAIHAYYQQQGMSVIEASLHTGGDGIDPQRCAAVVPFHVLLDEVLSRYSELEPIVEKLPFGLRISYKMGETDFHVFELEKPSTSDPRDYYEGTGIVCSMCHDEFDRRDELTNGWCKSCIAGYPLDWSEHCEAREGSY